MSYKSIILLDTNYNATCGKCQDVLEKGLFKTFCGILKKATAFRKKISMPIKDAPTDSLPLEGKGNRESGG